MQKYWFFWNETLLLFISCERWLRQPAGMHYLQCQSQREREGGDSSPHQSLLVTLLDHKSWAACSEPKDTGGHRGTVLPTHCVKLMLWLRGAFAAREIKLTPVPRSGQTWPDPSPLSLLSLSSPSASPQPSSRTGQPSSWQLRHWQAPASLLTPPYVHLGFLSWWQKWFQITQWGFRLVPRMQMPFSTAEM